MFGDAVIPRGGSLWLGSLLEIFAAMGIGGGVVRTAISRLASDQWLERTRIGRNSYYRLTGKGQAASLAAAGRIYGAPGPDWDGRFHLVFASTAADRECARGVLLERGFGVMTPGLWIAPGSLPVPPEAAGLLRMAGIADTDTGREIALRAWPLQATAETYRRFLGAFAPLHDSLAGCGEPPPLEALVARTLLVHEYRRVRLRDPCLPAALLPADWPGAAARRLCRDIYHALLPASERWLDQHGRAEAGRLPQATLDLGLRFAS